MLPIQKINESIGKYGCYFLCLLHTVDSEDDAIKLYKKYTKLGYMEDDCTILNPSAILAELQGRSYRVVKSTTDDSNADLRVLYWYNPRTKLHHFTLPDWDPLGDSITRKEGYVESYRLFYRK